MAKSAKNVAALSSALTLAMIVSATQSEQGFLFASAEAAAPFVNDGLAEQNEGMANPENAKEFATRATEKGISTVSTTTDPAAPIPSQGSTATGKPVFTIETIDAPTSKPRGGGGVNIYPFDDLAAPVKVEGQKDKLSAFFIPATEAKPKPWDSLQSAVSAATRRYATETGSKPFTKADGSTGTRKTYEYTRKFSVTEGDRQGVKGAWVSRTQ